MHDLPDFLLFTAVGCLFLSSWLAFHQKYSLCSVFSLLGAMSAAAGAVASFALPETKAFILPVNCVLFLLQGIAFFRVYRRHRQVQAGPEAEIQRVSATLNDSQVVLAYDRYRDSGGTCWHCGAADAPLRVVRLAKIHILGGAAASESIELAVPICDSHANNMNVIPYWVRTLSWPMGFITFAVVGGVFADMAEKGQTWARWVARFALVLGVFIGWRMWAWSNRHQTFRLCSYDIHNRLVVVQFNNADRAARVRQELKQTTEHASSTTM